MCAEPFDGVAEHYGQFGPRYPPALPGVVRRMCGLDGRGRLLDLGCGPGTLTTVLATFFSQVVAADPARGMVDACRRAALRRQLTNVEVVQVGSADLPADLGSFTHVLIARAFHWMDRLTTLTALDGMARPGGAVIIVDQHSEWSPVNPWPRLRDIARDMTCSAQDVEPMVRGAEQHEAVLRQSPFNSLAIRRIPLVESLSLDRVVGRALTTSWSAPLLRAGKEAECRAKMRACLRDLATPEFTESSVTIVRVARRSEKR